MSLATRSKDTRRDAYKYIYIYTFYRYAYINIYVYIVGGHQRTADAKRTTNYWHLNQVPHLGSDYWSPVLQAGRCNAPRLAPPPLLPPPFVHNPTRRGRIAVPRHGQTLTRPSGPSHRLLRCEPSTELSELEALSWTRRVGADYEPQPDWARAIRPIRLLTHSVRAHSRLSWYASKLRKPAGRRGASRHWDYFGIHEGVGVRRGVRRGVIWFENCEMPATADGAKLYRSFVNWSLWIDDAWNLEALLDLSWHRRDFFATFKTLMSEGRTNFVADDYIFSCWGLIHSCSESFIQVFP